jgi:hypothetical protein
VPGHRVPGDLVSGDLVSRLRDALAEAGYTYESVARLLGPVAHAALSRNETTPGLRATADGSALSVLVRLWLLQAPVSLDDLERALPGLVPELVDLGVLERSGAQARARLDVRPYADDDGDCWVLSDLTPGLDGTDPRIGADHVLGVSSASTSLAQLTVRTPVERALDLGTGCGVQSLHLAAHVQRIVATDVNPRALWLTRLNAALNGLTGERVDVRAGSLYEPVADDRFDLVVSNPPFVVSPATGERLVYRDSGLPGDELVRRVVTRAPAHLRPGGWCQLLANWVVKEGRPWDERVAGWLAGSGCDAWVVQREVADPASYVELWLKDAGLHGTAEYRERYDAWLAWFEEQHVEGVGFGWLSLHRTDRDDPVLRLEEWPYEVEQPLGPEVVGWASRTARGRCLDDDALLASVLTARGDVRQETVGPPGAEDPERIVLRQQRWMRRARSVDTVEAGLVGACDGELTVGAILGALATLLGSDPAAVRQAYLPVVRELLAEGFLTP